MQRAHEVYEKFTEGDDLSDQDVAFGRTFYKELADKLIKCGPVFHLAWLEANKVAQRFDGFYEARHNSSRKRLSSTTYDMHNNPIVE